MNDFEMKMNYFFEAQKAQDFETVWSIYEANGLEQKILKDKAYRVFYRFYAEDATVEELMNDTAEVIEVSSLAVNGTVKSLWAAAESCYKQAKQQGDWHKFIENFEMQDDGSLELVMGS